MTAPVARQTSGIIPNGPAHSGGIDHDDFRIPESDVPATRALGFREWFGTPGRGPATCRRLDPDLEDPGRFVFLVVFGMADAGTRRHHLDITGFSAPNIAHGVLVRYCSVADVGDDLGIGVGIWREACPGLFDGGRAHAQSVQADGSVHGARPNILVIKVDELRFPSVFPPGINGVDDFLKRFMPNVYQLWQNGVKFAGHYAAACACTPARGTIITGLYSQQSWLAQTITAAPGAPASLQPWLNPAYPTYGKLLPRVGYQTPYIGKWHVSIPRKDAPRLDEYGFDGLTWPDPTGANLQGTVGDESNTTTHFGHGARQKRLMAKDAAFQ